MQRNRFDPTPYYSTKTPRALWLTLAFYGTALAIVAGVGLYVHIGRLVAAVAR